MGGRAEAPFAVGAQVLVLGQLAARQAFAVRGGDGGFVGPDAGDAERALAGEAEVLAQALAHQHEQRVIP